MAWIGKLLGRKDSAQQAIDEYNLGLAAKYESRWEDSLAHNQRAAVLNADDEATWWNLAIAATALHNWSEARRGWMAVGIEPEQDKGEVTTPENWACVRLVPGGVAEVVWGKRIDPARIRVMNVPMPESDRRYGDILLNDGAPEGTRISRGREYPVFDELALWKMSEYSTYRVSVSDAGDEAKASLNSACEAAKVEFEDWGTVRILCAECSRGNPVEHACVNAGSNGNASYFGFAARSESTVRGILKVWVEMNPNVECGALEIVVAGVNA